MVTFPPSKKTTALDKSVNIRLRAWYKLCKKVGLISNQDEFRQNILSEKGAPISQAFVSSLMSASSAVPYSVPEQIQEAYPFTTAAYFITGQDDIIKFKSLLLYLLDRVKMNQKDLVNTLDHPSIKRPILSKMDNLSPLDHWQVVFDFFNKELDLKMDAEEMAKASASVGVPDQEFEGKDESVQRFFEFIETLKKNRNITTTGEFAQSIGFSPQQISNMTSQTVRQGLTKQMIQNTMKAWPRLNPDWLLLGEGDMFRSPGSAMPVLMEVKRELEKLNLEMKHIRERLDEK
jgi:hypothetical protein